MTSDLMDLLEDFRLYLVSLWSEVYLWQAGVSWDKFLVSSSSLTRQIWSSFLHQTLLNQLFFVLTAFTILFLSTFKLVMVTTSGVCKSKKKLDGKTVLVTGANAGLGYETAKDLAARGARVILGCRNMSKGIRACQRIAEETGNTNVEVKRLDLSAMSVVRQFAREFLEEEDRLDILILNAGVALTQKYLTEDGLELHMASNHFGHFLLANLLMEHLVRTSKKSRDPSRVVALSSLGHWWGKIELDNLNSERLYDSSRIYGTTKLCNLLFTKELCKRLKAMNVNVVVNAVHPGAVQTELFRNIPFLGPLIQWATGMFCKTAKMGAQTSIYCAVDDAVSNISGEYFADCKITSCSPDANDPKLAKDLWEKSVEILQMEDHEMIL